MSGRSIVASVVLLGALALSLGCSSSPTAPTTQLNIKTADPSLGSFQSTLLSAVPAANTTAMVTTDTPPWSVTASTWCQSGQEYGVVFVRESDGSILPDQTDALCEGAEFRQLAFSGPLNRPKLVEFMKGGPVVADFGTVPLGDWGKVEKTTVHRGTINIRLTLQ